MAETAKYVVGRAADLVDGGRVLVEVNGRSVGVFNIRNRYFAMLNRCPHMGAEVCKGTILGSLSAKAPGEYEYDASQKIIVCPWHGWEFDIETGHSYFDPAKVRTRQYPVSVESGATVQAQISNGEASFTPSDYAGLVAAAADDVHEARTRGPYSAEVITVTVEDDYLVISLRADRIPSKPSDPSATVRPDDAP